MGVRNTAPCFATHRHTRAGLRENGGLQLRICARQRRAQPHDIVSTASWTRRCASGWSCRRALRLTSRRPTAATAPSTGCGRCFRDPYWRSPGRARRSAYNLSARWRTVCPTTRRWRSCGRTPSRCRLTGGRFRAKWRSADAAPHNAAGDGPRERRIRSRPGSAVGSAQVVVARSLSGCARPPGMRRGRHLRRAGVFRDSLDDPCPLPARYGVWTLGS